MENLPEKDEQVIEKTTKETVKSRKKKYNNINNRSMSVPKRDEIYISVGLFRV